MTIILLRRLLLIITATLASGLRVGRTSLLRCRNGAQDIVIRRTYTTMILYIMSRVDVAGLLAQLDMNTDIDWDEPASWAYW